MILRLDRVSRAFGARVLFAGACLDVRRGDRVGLIGPNGSGKTTLLRIAAGDDPPDAGRVVVPRGVRIGMLRQEIDPACPRTVREEASTALARLDTLERTIARLEEEISRHGGEGREAPRELAERYERARTAFEHGAGYGRAARVDSVLAGLGFSAGDLDRPVRAFSGGWLMRVELARLFLSDPDVLLLDEPTNHLDLPSIEWFEGMIRDFHGGVIIISHDRTFLRRHVNRVAELAMGRFRLFELGYDAYVKERAQERERLRRRSRAEGKAIARTERFIERFRAKNTKARQVKAKIRALERRERVEVPEEERRRIRLRIPPVERSGDAVLTLEGVHKAYDDTVVYRGIDFRIRRGERVALVGPNGAGKTTLLRIAAGGLAFERGERRLGHAVSLQYYAQHQLETLDPDRTVLEEIEAVASEPGDRARCRGHLGAFLFGGEDVEKKVRVLSGGEKARLVLARMLLRPVNFLVLDEPTNHLDIRAREVLEEALAGYTGTMLFISHDRALINALARRVVEVRAGRLREFSGTYDDYLREAVEAAEGPAGSTGAPRGSEGRRRGERPPGEASTKAERVREREAVKARRRRLAAARRRMDAIEREIEALEAEVASADERMAEREVYTDGERMRAIQSARAEVQAAITRLEAEWVPLCDEVARLEQPET